MESSEASCVGLALLIACPWGKLKGPANDVRNMEEVLKKRGFTVATCCNDDATRSGILEAWESLITRIKQEKHESKSEQVTSTKNPGQTEPRNEPKQVEMESKTEPTEISTEAHQTRPNPGDTPAVVIYYSGHGGLVMPSLDQGHEHDLQGHEDSRSYQFLVPMDWDSGNRNFNGILDIEISHLLKRTTDQTKNVTLILDCCHAGRMARDPYHRVAEPRTIGTVKHQKLAAHVEQLRQAGKLFGKTDLEGNPDAVRIAAAATAETAFEYEDEKGEHVGALTKALAATLKNAPTENVSWRTILVKVKESVSSMFLRQNPRVEGPFTRIIFSTELMQAGSLHIRMENNRPIIQAGRINGVRKGSVYTVMPFGYEKASTENSLCEVEVVRANLSKSLAEIRKSKQRIPLDGALAFLKTEAPQQWAAKYPKDIEEIRTALETSKFLKPWSGDEDEPIFVDIRGEGETLCAYNSVGQLFISRAFAPGNLSSAAGDVISAAEQRARGHHLLTLPKGTGRDNLEHDLRVRIGPMSDGEPGKPLPDDGSANLMDGQMIYIDLQNKGGVPLYVSVFSVDAAGGVSQVSNKWVDGIEIHQGQTYTLGYDEYEFSLVGLPITWLNSLPTRDPVAETLVFVITNAKINLQHFVSPLSSAHAARRDDDISNVSGLEMLACHLAYGICRPVGSAQKVAAIGYDVYRFPYSVRPSA